MNYPIVIHKDEGSDYGVTVPDLPGCFSAGRTLDEAIAMAREAIELHLEGLIEDGQSIPSPSSIDRHKHNPEYKGGIWAVASVDPSSLRLSAKRVNITIPERVLDAVDRFADKQGETRSGLLVRAVTDYMARESLETVRAVNKGHPRTTTLDTKRTVGKRSAKAVSKKVRATPR